MDETPLEEFLEDEGQRLAYRFDPESRRLLLLEVMETSFGKSLDKPLVRRKRGEAPLQMLVEEEIVAPTNVGNTEELEESFYGDDGYEEGELDEEGFDVIGEE